MYDVSSIPLPAGTRPQKAASAPSHPRGTCLALIGMPNYFKCPNKPSMQPLSPLFLLISLSMGSFGK